LRVSVWTYWEGERPPYIDACLETISRHAVDVRLLDPGVFFARAADADHQRNVNPWSLRDLLANTMNRQYVAAHPGADLLAEGTFFRSLRAKALAVEICESASPDSELGWGCVSGNGEVAFHCSRDICV
jgi:hypothetical protein